MSIDTGNQPEDPSDTALPPKNSDPSGSGGDPELAAQAAHPTTLFAAVDPVFRQALRNRLLERLAAHQAPEAIGRPPEQVPGEASLQQQAQEETIHEDQQSPPSYRDADAEAIQGDPELKVLAARLDLTAPFATIDPVFRQRLRTQLVGALSELCYSSLETPVGRLYLAYNDEVLQLVSAEDEVVFLDKVLLVLGKKPKWEPALPAPMSRCILSAIRGLGPYTGLLDLSRLTPMEQAALEQVQQIPRGELRSYEQVAHEIGYPKAAHTVYEALIHNPVPFVIPCHRVIHASGALSAYAGGEREIQERLLAYEGVNPMHLDTYLPVSVSSHDPDYKPLLPEGYFTGARKRLTENLFQTLASIWQRVYFFLRVLLYDTWGSSSPKKLLGIQQPLANYGGGAWIPLRATPATKWAMERVNLGNAYLRSAGEEQRENLKRAIACYEAALQVYTCNVFPAVHRIVQISRADAEARQGNWAGVHAAYTGARAAEELLVCLSRGNARYGSILKERHDVAARDAFALSRLGWLEAAAILLERGQTHLLLIQPTFDVTAASDHIRGTVLKARYDNTCRAFIDTQAMLNAPLQHDLTESERYQMVLERTQAYCKKQKALDEVVVESRTTFPQDILDAATIQQAAAYRGAGHAIVYLTATPWGGVAVAALNANPSLGTQARFAALDLPALTESLLQDLYETRLGDSSQSIIGGFMYAERGEGLDLLREWKGATIRKRGEALHASCIAAGKASALDRAFREMLDAPSLVHLADQPLEKLTATDIIRLRRALEHLFLQLDLEHCLKLVARLALRPLVAWLREQGVISLTLIPCGRLAAFPLTAILITNEQTVSDTLPTSVAPTVQSLQCEEHTETKRLGIYMIGGPHPTHHCNSWCEAGAEILAKLAYDLGIPPEFKLGQQATRADTIQALHKGQIVYFSCHREYDSSDLSRSALVLARGERLTLAELLNHTVDMRGLRLLILSACQTTVFGKQRLSDEMRSLAAEMVQAGAKEVLASLWPVDGKAAYLLITRFAQEWLPRMDREPSAAALARAQRWLRTATNRDLQKWFATSISKLERQSGASLKAWERETEPRLKKADNRVGARKQVVGSQYGIPHGVSEIESPAMMGRDNPDVRPYVNPIYWAGFHITGG